MGKLGTLISNAESIVAWAQERRGNKELDLRQEMLDLLRRLDLDVRACADLIDRSNWHIVELLILRACACSSGGTAVVRACCRYQGQGLHVRLCREHPAPRMRPAHWSLHFSASGACQVSMLHRSCSGPPGRFSLWAKQGADQD